MKRFKRAILWIETMETKRDNKKLSLTVLTVWSQAQSTKAYRSHKKGQMQSREISAKHVHDVAPN